MTLTIRRGDEADIPALQDLERDAAQAFRSIGYDFCADGPVRTYDEHQRDLQTGAVFVAEVDGQLAGFILMWPVDGRAHITEVSVAERYQQLGIGRSLVSTGERWAQEQGYSEITLTTFRDVSWNAPFYASLGYQIFTPDSERTELAAVRAEEIESGFHAKPRVAMKKQLLGIL